MGQGQGLASSGTCQELGAEPLGVGPQSCDTPSASPSAGGWTTFAMPVACGPGWRQDHPQSCRLGAWVLVWVQASASVCALGSAAVGLQLYCTAVFKVLWLGCQLSSQHFEEVALPIQLHTLPTWVTPAPASVGDEGPACASRWCPWFP